MNLLWASRYQRYVVKRGNSGELLYLRAYRGRTAGALSACRARMARVLRVYRTRTADVPLVYLSACRARIARVLRVYRTRTADVPLVY